MPNEAQAIKPGVGAVIQDPDGRVLLHFRADDRGWAPPSGTLEPGETVLAALERELKEETGLQVQVERFVGVYSDPAYQVVDFPDGRVQFVTCLFLCRAETSDVVGNEEGLDWRWYPPDALPEDLLPYARRWLADTLRDCSITIVR